MAFTQTDIDTLDRAIASGELTIRFADGREITYRSVAELRSARSLMQGDVAAAGGTRLIRQVRLTSSKGF